MNQYQNWKPVFDFVLAAASLLVLLPILLLLYIFCSLDVRSNGIFCQTRIGQYGKPFTIYKFCTIHPVSRRISPLGAFLRKCKLDELPQLLNILKGEMSFVGPRPDIPGYYDLLKGDDRRVLKLKPGLTSEAGIKYRNEEEILRTQPHPLEYNDQVLFPDKVQMNLRYLDRMSLREDLRILFSTVKTFL